MRLSIITALHNCLSHTQAMLASLRPSLPAPLDWELIFVDDASSDGTREWLHTLAVDKRIRVLLQPENLGFAAANNRAAATATGDILALLNNDLELAPGWLDPMLAALDSRPDAALVGNVQRTPDGAIHHTGVYINARGKPEHDRRVPSPGVWTPSSATGHTIRDVVITTAACALARRDTFAQLGGFDESFRNGHEDVDLCLRARAAGLRNYVALDSSVLHHVSASRGRDRTKIANSARGMNRWRASLPDLAGEAWRDPHLRPVWEKRLSFAARLRASLARPAAGSRPAAFPRWLRTVVAHRIESQLARWRRDLGGVLPQ
ncbi:MAG TPA: glycosyltransferase family 2 protein [Opitutus sp.]|nr:glycosyltransferase family 2 protein [Opitutus sp.]